MMRRKGQVGDFRSRRRVTTRGMSLVLLAASVLSAAGCNHATQFAGDWPMFRGGPARLGADGASSLPDRPPAVAWVFTDGTARLPVTFWSSPIVRGQRLYVGGGALSPFGTRGYIYCLDVSGAGAGPQPPRVLWKHKVDKLVFSSPALTAGIVLCGEGTHTDTDTALYALQSDSPDPQGQRLWRFQVPGPVEASPCVDGGRVYFGTWDDFHCLDLRTGRPLWKATVVDVLSSPVVANGMVYVGSGRSEQARPENRAVPGRQLLALDAATGLVRWREALPYACSSPITYADGRLIAGAGKGTFILAGAGRSAGAVICHDAATGRPLWSRQLPDNVLAAIPVAAGLVHAACRDGKYYLMSLADGQLLWEYAADAALLASPIVSGDRVLLLSSKGVAHCLDVKARSLLWKLDLPQAAGQPKTAQVFSSPMLAGGHIYVGLADRGLVCLRPS